MTKILLVEDDKSLREIYGVRLLAEGYDIVSAGDGEEALAMAIKEKPQLIVSDVMMPKISGFDMLDILRSTTETRDIKVIMMTALSSDDQRTRGEQLGADKYLIKSQVGIEDVVRTVHETLADSGGSTKSDAPSGADTSSGENKIENKEDNTSNDQAPPLTSAESNTADDTPSKDDKPNNADDAPASVPQTNTIDNNGSSEDTDNAKEESNMPPAGDDAAPTATTDSSDSVTSTPGNEDAGPLPPQPTEMESTLPEPTAPFSSPRPTNLGENAMNPTDSTNPVPDNSGAPVPPAGDGGVPPVPPVEPPVAPPVPEAPAPEAPVPPAPGVPGEDQQQPPAAPPAV